MEKNKNREIGLSRREFVVGAAGVVMATTTITTLSSCSSAKEEDTLGLDGLSAISVSNNEVINVTDTPEQNAADHLRLIATYDIAPNSLLFMNSDSFSIVISPGTNTSDLTKLGFMSIPSGKVTYFMEHAIGAKEGYVIYDARANDNILIWVECNMRTNAWKVFAAKVGNSKTKISGAVQVDEGDVDFDPPMLTVSGNKGFWTVMPDDDGSASNTDSYLKSISIGQNAPTTEYVSHGRPATNPESSRGIVCFVPRTNSNSIYYQMTALDSASSEVVAAEVLPKSMRCSICNYVGGNFVFGIEKSYDFGGGLANFGTYVKVQDGYVRINKTPTDDPALCGKYLVVKGDKALICVNVADTQLSHFVIEALSEGATYGDYLASSGQCKRIVTYTSVQNSDASGVASTRVRIFELE